MSVLLGEFLNNDYPLFVIRTSNFGTYVELACVSRVYIPSETKAEIVERS